jgi:hypothetical protein
MGAKRGGSIQHQPTLLLSISSFTSPPARHGTGRTRGYTHQGEQGSLESSSFAVGGCDFSSHSCHPSSSSSTRPTISLPHAFSPRATTQNNNLHTAIAIATDRASPSCRVLRSTSVCRHQICSPFLPPTSLPPSRRPSKSAPFARHSASRHGSSTSRCALRCPHSSRSPTSSPSSR